MRKIILGLGLLASTLLLIGCSQFQRPPEEGENVVVPGLEEGVDVAKPDEVVEKNTEKTKPEKTGEEEEEAESGTAPAENSGQDSEENTSSESSSTSVEKDQPPVAGEVKVFNVEAKQFEFIPAVITVNEGDMVRLVVKSTDVKHGIAIPEFGINKILPANETVTVEFVANKKGTFSMFCSVFCGSDHGSMKGTLIVN